MNLTSLAAASLGTPSANTPALVTQLFALIVPSIHLTLSILLFSLAKITLNILGSNDRDKRHNCANAHR